MNKPALARYRTTNWSSYSAALRKRGSLLIWLDKKMTWLVPHDGSPKVTFLPLPGCSARVAEAGRYGVFRMQGTRRTVSGASFWFWTLSSK